jgi:hypothetical protein
VSQWVSSADRQALLLAKCVLRDFPEALTPNMVRALVDARVELPAHLLQKFPDIGTNPVNQNENDQTKTSL